jgi:hypothetical protein
MGFCVNFSISPSLKKGFLGPENKTLLLILRLFNYEKGFYVKDIFINKIELFKITYIDDYSYKNESYGFSFSVVGYRGGQTSFQPSAFSGRPKPLKQASNR